MEQNEETRQRLYLGIKYRNKKRYVAVVTDLRADEFYQNLIYKETFLFNKDALRESDFSAQSIG